MLRTLSIFATLCVPGLAGAQAPVCLPEVATVTVDVPTGRCAATLPAPLPGVPAPVVQAPVVPAPVVQAPVVAAPVVQAPVVPAPVVQAPAAPAWGSPPLRWPAPPGAAWTLPPPPRVELPVVEEQTRELRGLWIPGALILGAGWIASGVATLASDSDAMARGLGFLPVLGPWIQLERGGNDPLLTLSLWVSGIAQAAGLAMTVIGASVRRRVRSVEVAIAPTEGGAALAVAGRF